MIPSKWKKTKPSGQYYRNVGKEYKELMTKKPPVRIVRLSRRPNQISPVNIAAPTPTVTDNNTAPVLAIIESASADASQNSDALPSISSFSSHQNSEASIDSPQASSDDFFGLCTYYSILNRIQIFVKC